MAEALGDVDERVFPESTRFRVESVLGRGAFGTVFAVRDEERSTSIAAKVLHHDHPRALARFKHEFRALADLHHPNLVRLYELHERDGSWFFTMQRLAGRDPIAWLSGRVPLAQTLDGSIDADAAPREAPDEPASPIAEVVPPPDGSAGATRSVFAQVARGLQALHEAGLLHRDLKPSNVLVDAQGHVTVLDFGLSRSLQGGAPEPRGLVGTRRYLAPEIAAGDPASAASDWFAMGVMLHEALASRAPLRTGEGEVELALPEARDEGEATLRLLCAEMLATDPQARPSGREVLERLDARRGPAPVWIGEADSLFVGRRAEQVTLHEALEATREGSRLALISGPSGGGKSALARAICRQAQSAGALVLAGRCFQQEALPLKALDGIVDALASALADAELPDAAAVAVLEAHAEELGRVFPVLRVLDPVERAIGGASTREPHEIRRRAFAGLRRLLGALARRRRVIVFIDDMQWGDAESAGRLGELVEGNDGPGVLVLGTVRDDEREGSSFFAALAKLLPKLSAGGRLHEVELQPLPAEDCEALAAGLLGAATPHGRDSARIARESGGSPFFVEELVRQVRRGDDEGAALAPTVADAVRTRIGSLSPETREVFELVAVAGPPISTTSVIRAAGVGPRAWFALDTLRAAHLVRTHARPDVMEVESYHARIRECSLETLAASSRAGLHLRLADALEHDRSPDLARVAQHLVAGGAPERAVDPADQAAAAAYDALAFERAAELWGVAIGGLGDDGARRRALEGRRADALVAAGRAAEAAPRLEDLAQRTGDVVDLRRAAEQWLTSGHVDRGTRVMQRALEQLDLSWPRSAAGAVASAVVRIPGLVLARPRPAVDVVDERRAAQVDACWSAVRGLSSVDHVRGLYFCVQGLRLALRLGEPTRCIRLGLFVAAQLRAVGAPGSESMFARYREQAVTSEDPELTTYVDYLDGYVDLQRGDPTRAAQSLRRAVARFEGECVGVGWEVTIALNMLCEAVHDGGDVGALAELSLRARRRAEALSDINGIQGALTYAGLVALARGQVTEARQAWDELLAMWTAQGFHYPHFMSALCRNACDLYEGEPARAWARLTAMAPDLRRSGLDRAPYVRARHLARRAACGVAMLATPQGRGDRGLHKAVRASTRALRRMDRPDGAAEVAQLDAALAWLAEDLDTAGRGLADARDRFAGLGMQARARVCELRRLQVGGADEAAVAAARQDIASLGVHDPSRWAAVHAPGFVADS